MLNVIALACDGRDACQTRLARTEPGLIEASQLQYNGDPREQDWRLPPAISAPSIYDRLADARLTAPTKGAVPFLTFDAFRRINATSNPPSIRLSPRESRCGKIQGK